MGTKTAALLFVLCSIHSASILAAEPKWSEISGEREITITVNQEDGTTRELIIWFAVVGGEGYIRTRNTSWRAEIERDPSVLLRIGGDYHPIRVRAVAKGALYDQVNAAFTEKYGILSDVFLAAMRPFLGAWNVYRVGSR